MKRKLIKGLVLVTVLTTMAISLVGCSTKAECALCGEVTSCKKYEVLGEEEYLCDTCYDSIEEIIEMFNEE